MRARAGPATRNEKMSGKVAKQTFDNYTFFCFLLNFYGPQGPVSEAGPQSRKNLENDPKMRPKSIKKAPQGPPEERKKRFKPLQVFPSKPGFNFGQFWLQNGSQNGAGNRSKTDVAAGWPPKGRPEAPRAAQRPPGNHFGCILAPFLDPPRPQN